LESAVSIVDPVEIEAATRPFEFGARIGRRTQRQFDAARNRGRGGIAIDLMSRRGSAGIAGKEPREIDG
jgi:hypothetical protein